MGRKFCPITNPNTEMQTTSMTKLLTIDVYAEKKYHKHATLKFQPLELYLLQNQAMGMGQLASQHHTS